MNTQIYLFFDGRTEEALEFYKKTLGIEVGMLMRFKEAPADPDIRPVRERDLIRRDQPADGGGDPLPLVRCERRDEADR